MGYNNLLFESLFNRKLSATSTREYLTQITDEHPYFSPAQFYLLLLLPQGSTAYEKQAAKTSILFNNTWWLQFQLQENRPNFEETDEMIVEPFPQIILPESKESIVLPSNQPTEAPANHATDINNQTAIVAIIQEEATPPAVEAVELLHTENNMQGFEEENAENPITEENIILEKENWMEVTPEPIGKGLDFIDGNVLPELTTVIETDLSHHEISVSTAVSIEDEMNDTRYPVHFNKESSLLENEPEAEETSLNEEEIKPLNFKLNIEPSTTTADSIPFEPLHTTDYFASLGIKLTGEIQSSDKLGKQLKSFTEWLKTMKKIHPDQVIPQSVATDISIQKLAEQSNKEGEVVTEAMAEVLLQQGKADKAIEVYKKLSLLNTSKSAYFAAKIDQLKH